MIDYIPIFSVYSQKRSDCIVLSRELLTPDSAAVWVCVDSFSNQELQGTFYSCFQENPTLFSGTGTLLIKLENLCDTLRCPDSFFEKRDFIPKTPPKGSVPSKKNEPNYHLRLHKPAALKNHSGKLATFEIKIIFRQHASWQGRITWKEGGRINYFRSALEMLHLIYNALENPPDGH